MADQEVRVRKPVCPECFDFGRTGDECPMCLALRGLFDSDSGEPGSFMWALNSVGARESRMAQQGESAMGQAVNAKEALRLLPQDYTAVEIETVSPEPRTPEEQAEDDATLVQAMSEGVKLGKVGGKLDRSVEFAGKRFPIATKVGLMPLMEFAFHANSGMDTGDMKALVAIYEMLKDCIDPDHWDEFVKHAKLVKADAEELLPVVNQTVELLTARPTRPDSDSSTQSPGMPESLMDNSSGQMSGLVPVTDLRQGFMG